MFNPNLISVIVTAAIGGTMVCLAFALTLVNPVTDVEHTNHANSVKQPKLGNIERIANIVTTGYAKNLTAFRIDKEYIDPEISCEFCTRVTFVPVKGQRASVAYEVNNVDLTGMRRVVFFAMGQKGGEELYFLAVGKKEDRREGRNEVGQGMFFTNINFIKSTKIQLDNTWHRYEFNLKGDDLSGVSYPFGFAILPANTTAEQVIYLKGITFDDRPAKDVAATKSTQ